MTTLPLPSTNTASQQLSLVTKPAVAIEGPKFSARDKLTEAKREEVRVWAQKLLADPGFDVTFFIGLIQDFDVKQTPGLDAMLENIKMRDAGAVGQHVQAATRRMREVNGKLPKFDPKIVEKFNAGRAKAREVLNWVKYVANQIREALEQYQSVLDVMEKDIAMLEAQYQLMIEAVVRDDQLADEADERTEKLLYLCAALEYLKELLAARLAELSKALAATPNDGTLAEEKERLESISPLLLKRFNSLPSFIHMGNMNEKRFLGQRNSNAIVAITLGDFIEMGVPQWKNDVVAQLDSLQAQAAMFSVQVGIDFMNEQAMAAADAYEDQIAQSAALLKEMFLKVETMNRVADALIKSGEILTQALRDASVAGQQSSREVERGRGDIQRAEDKMSAELAEIMASA